MTIDIPDEDVPISEPNQPDLLQELPAHVKPDFPVFAPIALIFLSVLSWTGRALIPFIEDVPLLVVGLNPDPYLIPIVVDNVNFWALLIIASLRLMVADPIWYHLGRYFTEWVLSTKGNKKSKKAFKKPRKILEALVDHRDNKHLKSRFSRWGIRGVVYLLVLLYATGFVMCAAGILELHRRIVIPLVVIGTVAQVYGLMALGNQLF